MKKTIHIVWVGDESIRPDAYINSWVDLNPTWEIKVWGNHELENYEWRLKSQLMHRWHTMKEMNGVADIMRWEIIHNEGGFGIDADGPCIRPLEDWLFEGTKMAACYESEYALPGRIASGYLYCMPKNEIVNTIIERIAKNNRMENFPAWRALATMQITYEYHKRRPVDPEFRIWPSHYFIPQHRWAPQYQGLGPVFSKQMFMSTHGTYKQTVNYDSTQDEYNFKK
ncbi:hypothetical protein B9Z35_08185 [Limnohabitans sp. Jir61]|jgi:mannosyltransferase OCH1-like enzyme|uniref:glycosyltransferase n=1 Tax=Limnohabitans sp. Jir61 TaxID=1826168 RepID=UPI000D360B99|nr:glycosyltransferase [Limnohabitans sp. Jir61]PUE31005.1 hypothetical protein B9Z35_08185 [Limnohabitans sp. Jir61]